MTSAGNIPVVSLSGTPHHHSGASSHLPGNAILAPGATVTIVGGAAPTPNNLTAQRVVAAQQNAGHHGGQQAPQIIIQHQAPQAVLQAVTPSLRLTPAQIQQQIQQIKYPVSLNVNVNASPIQTFQLPQQPQPQQQQQQQQQQQIVPTVTRSGNGTTSSSKTGPFVGTCQICGDKFSDTISLSKHVLEGHDDIE